MMFGVDGEVLYIYDMGRGSEQGMFSLVRRTLNVVSLQIVRMRL